MAAANPQTPIAVTWRAGRDGIGHALPYHAPRGHPPTRYLCNGMVIAERYAWPVKSKCPTCVAAVEGTIAAETEAEARFAFGDR